jgi:hypothetical protein
MVKERSLDPLYYKGVGNHYENKYEPEDLPSGREYSKKKWVNFKFKWCPKKN